jgi:uncharacterized protein (DUF433 family)
MDAHVVRDGRTGEAVMAATGISVAAILRELAGKAGVAAALEAFPELTAEDVAAAVAFATIMIEHEPPYSELDPSARPGMVRESALASGWGAEPTPVFLGQDEYDGLLDEMELLRELCVAQVEVAAGETLSEDEAFAYLRGRLGG